MKLQHKVGKRTANEMNEHTVFILFLISEKALYINIFYMSYGALFYMFCGIVREYFLYLREHGDHKPA